jgi:hypothetical protein
VAGSKQGHGRCFACPANISRKPAASQESLLRHALRRTSQLP